MRLKKILSCLIISATTFLSSTNSYSDTPYLICGPDEDGCSENGYEYCSCVPYNPIQGELLYCFDFNRLVCKPLADMPNCPKSFIYQNQASCLATLFQSGPVPPCTLTTLETCKAHHSYVCDKDGDLNSCLRM